MLVWEALGSKLAPPRRSASALGALALAGALAFKLLPLPGRAGFAAKIFVLFLGFGALCFCVFARPESRLARGFAWTPLRWLGNMSYSYYLVHGLALHATFLGVGRVLGRGQASLGLFFGLLPFAFAISVVVSALMYLAVELRWSLSPTGRTRATR
jgi:peptidoglycan/LPS O-acetylase OafA/YrhL